MWWRGVGRGVVALGVLCVWSVSLVAWVSRWKWGLWLCEMSRGKGEDMMERVVGALVSWW